MVVSGLETSFVTRREEGSSLAEKSIVLFGCGRIGYQVMQLLNKENILCFCDNNVSLQGTLKWEKPVISLEQLMNKYSSYTLLVCVDIPKAYRIMQQLDEIGISDYWLYPAIKEDMENLSVDGMLEFLRDRDAMYHFRMECYQVRIGKLEEQVDYMKTHTDIRSMKPATGKLRERQLGLVELSAFVFQAMEAECPIRPFLCGGNLLGYIRHNGFVPWDDDIDFELIREDYEQLYQYCLSHQDKDGLVVFQYGGRTEKLQFVARHNLFKLMSMCSDKPVLSLDFFSLDYYADDYSFEMHQQDVRKVWGELYGLDNEGKLKHIRDAMKKNMHIAKKSKSIFYGFDNQESIRLYNIGKMMPENVVFPLKKIDFEGKPFWIPNEPEEFLSYTYKNIWEFPDDVGIEKHSYYYGG